MLTRFGMLLALVVSTPSIAMAAADFSKSTIVMTPAAPQEGEVVECLITVRNTGNTAADPTHLMMTGPRSGYLLSVSGLPEAKVDLEARTVEASTSIPAGGELQFRLKLLAPRLSAGDMLSITAHALHFSNPELWLHGDAEIAPRSSTAGIQVGATRITPAGIAVGGWLLTTLLLWAVLALLAPSTEPTRGKQERTARLLRTATSPRSAALALMIPIGFWMIFGSMAYRDWQTFATWTETKAEIVGRRDKIEVESKPNPQHQATVLRTPEYALRYPVADGEIISTGYDTGTSLRIGGRVMQEQELRDWTVGAVIPCWYDPQNPGDVIVRRGFGGAHLFALFPIPVFLYGLLLTRGLIARYRQRTLPQS